MQIDAKIYIFIIFIICAYGIGEKSSKKKKHAYSKKTFLSISFKTYFKPKSVLVG